MQKIPIYKYSSIARSWNCQEEIRNENNIFNRYV